MSEKVVVVTGASSVIGEALAQLAAERGNEVIAGVIDRVVTYYSSIGSDPQ